MMMIMMKKPLGQKKIIYGEGKHKRWDKKNSYEMIKKVSKHNAKTLTLKYYAEKMLKHPGKHKR